MKPRRPHKSFVDAEFPLSDAEAESLLKRSILDERSIPGNRSLHMLIRAWWLACPVTIFVVHKSGYPFWIAVLAGVSVFVVSGVIMNAMTHRRVARIFREQLRERGHEICVECGYWLRGLDDNVKQCPECGAEREAMPAAPREDQ